jgi:hypothetical protein
MLERLKLETMRHVMPMPNYSKHSKQKPISWYVHAHVLGQASGWRVLGPFASWSAARDKALEWEQAGSYRRTTVCDRYPRDADAELVGFAVSSELFEKLSVIALRTDSFPGRVFDKAINDFLDSVEQAAA